MTPKNNILNELKELNVSLPVVSMPDMSLPQNYFDTLGNEITAEIKTNEFLSSLSSVIPYEVPDGYFEGLNTEILAQVHIAHFLDSLPKQTPFHKPADYFETLSDVVVTKSVKVNRINPLRATRTFYGKMAVAASLFVLLAIGFLLMTQTSAPKNVETQLAQISDTEIDNYIQDHAYEFDNHISYQLIDESNIDINKLENDIYNSYFDNITEDEINNFL